ncbi:MAG TPA: NUDIX hydrolase [Acidimicrobiales bacterium]|nr:NUDIX hydrolase [Acidimicrobiales bacterium]
MKWKVHGERFVYESDWMSVALVDIELPDGERFEHHALRSVSRAAGTVIHDPDRGVLMLWRHRFIPDTWGWEIPAGKVDEGESLEAAAIRESVEETGWRPRSVRPLISYTPMGGLCDQVFDVFLAEAADYVGEPESRHESDRIDWLPVPKILELIREGDIKDGFSLVGVMAALMLLRTGTGAVGPGPDDFDGP